ncbi:MAG: hypothetical protein HC780_06170 [Leptolyngbyaceae cyanobacterium CSU_1_3]|nr:hypothetical protein [Leptolyngbyaceae cyanobacterium CSU_1_3]
MALASLGLTLMGIVMKTVLWSGVLGVSGMLPALSSVTQAACREVILPA